ncbi:dioxygenase [Sporothrix schenckii 1099-18]|uniref:Dioxygenase n=1 Tax=Sporothrix schenckii 1099-18 TaxID=1397361 RepID=A0A0F2MMX3_SPOSC|nr:dioxygenase [Sporothrix schenckii 1099-18]KJR89521.1 dioxygenase [Sporothrix schenckii 1099-18]
MGSVPVALPAKAVVLPPPLPGYRTVADEKTDHTETLKRVQDHAFTDWPNEAGFDGLREERGPIEIPVVGTIPAYAAGSLYRTGPGMMKVEGTPKGTHYISHWFDGLAHTHRFEIVPDEATPGTVSVFYSSRRQSEARMRLMQEQGAAKIVTFAQRADPCIGLLGKFMSTFKAAALRRNTRLKDSENVNVVVHLDVPGLQADRPAAAKAADRRSMAVVPSVEAAKDGDVQRPTAPPAAPPAAGHRSANLPDSVWITTDVNIMRRVDPATLEPIGVANQETLHPDLKGAMSSAHAQRDPVTGDFFNFNLDLGPSPTYRVFRVSQATGKTDILATIRCRHGPASAPGSTSGGGNGNKSYTSGARPAYIHSFFLTTHYVVLCIPCTHVAQNGLKILWERNILDGLEPFSAANKTRWIVVDRQPDGKGVVAEFDSPAGFFFHSVNSFEDEEANCIVCDVIDYPTSDIIHALYYDVLLNRNNAAVDFYNDPVRAASVTPSLSRYRLKLPSSSSSGSTAVPVTAATQDWAVAGPHAGELPTINPKYATRRHRFVYSVASQGRSTLADALCKTDTETRAALLWHAPPGHTPGEAVFIGNPDATDDATGEDDGVLLSVVLDGTASKSYLLCLDARTMAETGRAEVGFAIGFGFHGAHAKA